MSSRAAGAAAVLALAALLLTGSASGSSPPWTRDLALFNRGIDRAAAYAPVDQLAQGLLARRVVRSGGVAWEYCFWFDGGRPPWISGMAQAVAAQALSRAGALLADPTLTAASQRAFKTVPQLTRKVDAGP